jgi:hypothetical protein
MKRSAYETHHKTCCIDTPFTRKKTPAKTRRTRRLDASHAVQEFLTQGVASGASGRQVRYPNLKVAYHCVSRANVTMRARHITVAHDTFNH